MVEGERGSWTEVSLPGELRGWISSEEARVTFANGCVANLTASRISMHMQRTIGI